ncbi:MAG: hypothetical protein HQ541_01160 [Mariniphaga sp.]|nr:hypothetical protein [Mariniphaga sp.]
MKKAKIYLLVCLFILVLQINAQGQNSTPLQNDKTSIGIGIGLDHGGVGGNVLMYPHKNIGVFAGVGYAFAGIGFNAGAKVRLASDNPTSRVIPYAIGMYGYNAAIQVTNKSDLNKFFYGPSVGVGIDLRSKNPNKNSYWSFAILYPVRSSEVDEYRDDLSYYHNVVFENELIPVAFSINYRLIIKYFDN